MIQSFKKGELLTMSKGEYSDYCVEGLFKVLIDFYANEQFVSWAKETNRKIINNKAEGGYSTKEGFIPWLSRNGFIEDVEYRELYLGCYGNTEISEI